MAVFRNGLALGEPPTGGASQEPGPPHHSSLDLPATARLLAKGIYILRPVICTSLSPSELPLLLVALAECSRSHHSPFRSCKARKHQALLRSHSEIACLLSASNQSIAHSGQQMASPALVNQHGSCSIVMDEFVRCCADLSW
jgi:hypothetical protein